MVPVLRQDLYNLSKIDFNSQINQGLRAKRRPNKVISQLNQSTEEVIDKRNSPQAQIEKKRRRGIWHDDIELLTDDQSENNASSDDTLSPYDNMISKYVSRTI